MRSSIIIIGAGASGLFLAGLAAKRGFDVIILEHNESPAKKLLITGGGRCNFTNAHISADKYLSKNPHFVKSAIARFGTNEILHFFDEHKLAYEQEEDGKYFCKTGARAVAEMLIKGCMGARLITSCKINEVVKSGYFDVDTSQGKFSADKLVIASGGLSYKQLGASDIGYRIAKKFKLRLIQTRPALVPLKTAADGLCKLSGLSFMARVRAGDAIYHGSILVTHNGLSGPAILNSSLHLDKNNSLLIDLFPSQDALQVLQKHSVERKQFATVLSLYLPSRLAHWFCDLNSFNLPMSKIGPKKLSAIANTLHNLEIKITSTLGFDKAEVTLGGVDTNHISSKTMESTETEGLYFIGEVLDVTGLIGGYNLHWAFASANAAASEMI